MRPARALARRLGRRFDGHAAPPGGVDRWWRPAPRTLRLVAQGVVLAVVAGGTTALASLHRDVTLDVDGRTIQASGFGGTVGDVLARHGIEVGERDLVAPGLDAPVVDDGEIVVRTARRLTLEVDGEQRTVWTTALTVGEAVDDLGLRDPGTRVSASRSAALGRTSHLRVSTTKTVRVAVDGELIEGRTSASTVREALREIGIVLGEQDRVSVPLDAGVVDGLVVLVTRVVSTGGTETVTQPFSTQVVEDPNLLEGTEIVTQVGRAGTKIITYSAETIGGQEVGRTVVAEVVVNEPQDRIVKRGTMKLPDAGSVPPVQPGSARAIGKDLAAARGWGDDQFACLDRLWTRESGWRYNAHNRSSGAYGIPQALPGSKMASAGSDWQTNPATQITWGLGYIANRYGDPCGAWAHFVARGWY